MSGFHDNMSPSTDSAGFKHSAFVEEDPNIFEELTVKQIEDRGSVIRVIPEDSGRRFLRKIYDFFHYFEPLAIQKTPCHINKVILNIEVPVAVNTNVWMMLHLLLLDLKIEASSSSKKCACLPNL